MMEAADILVGAAETLVQRGAIRDQHAERSMSRIVAAFNSLTGHQLTENEGWIFMATLKLARASGGKPHVDDWLDLAGYAALGGEHCAARVGTSSAA